MNFISKILMFSFFFSFASQNIYAASEINERKVKRKVSKALKKIRVTKDVEVKAKVMNALVKGIDKNLQEKINSSDKLNSEQITLAEEFRLNMIDSFEMVDLNDANSINQYTHYLESEMNQAHVGAIAVLIYVTVGVTLYMIDEDLAWDFLFFWNLFYWVY